VWFGFYFCFFVCFFFCFVLLAERFGFFLIYVGPNVSFTRLIFKLDPFVPHFWQENLALPILDKALLEVKTSDPKTQKGKLEVVRNLGRCFALLSLNGKWVSV
jgi:hypothetical protein